MSAALTYMQALLANAVLYRAQQVDKKVTLRDAKGTALFTDLYAIVREMTKKEQELLQTAHAVEADCIVEIPRQTVAEGVFKCTGIFPHHRKITYGNTTYEVVHVSHDDVEISDPTNEQESAVVDCYCLRQVRGVGEGV